MIVRIFLRRKKYQPPVVRPGELTAHWFRAINMPYILIMEQAGSITVTITVIGVN